MKILALVGLLGQDEWACYVCFIYPCIAFVLRASGIARTQISSMLALIKRQDLIFLVLRPTTFLAG